MKKHIKTDTLENSFRESYNSLIFLKTNYFQKSADKLSDLNSKISNSKSKLLNSKKNLFKFNNKIDEFSLELKEQEKKV